MKNLGYCGILIYMSKVLNVKNIVIALAVVLITALFAVCFFGGDVKASASEEYLINLTSSTAVYAGKNLSAPIVVTKNGNVFNDYTITYTKGGEIVDGMKDVGTYGISVTINGVEPLVQKDFTFTITPKPLKIVVGGGVEFLYSGMGYTRNVSPLGEIDGEDSGIVVTYRGDLEELEPGELPVNADNYDMVFATSNPNYSIGEIEGETNLIIHKRTLKVKVNDTSVTFGETPMFTYSIIGFVGKEDESILDRKPEVRSSATAVGTHNVVASGGASQNYNFEYEVGHLTINDVKAEGKIEGTSTTFDVSGVFAPFTLYAGSTIDPKSEEGKDLVKTARDYRMLNFTSDLQLVYQIDYTHGVQVSEKIDVVFHNVTLNTDDKYVIVVIDPNGVVTQITKYEYLNGTLSFRTPSLGTVMIFKDTYDTSVLLIVLGCMILFIVLLFIGSKMQYRNDKRQADEAKKRREIKRRGKYKWN